MIKYGLLAILNIYILTASLSCSSKEEKREKIWEEVNETTFWCVGLERNKENCCDEIYPKLKMLDELGAEPYQTASYKIKCNCLKGNYEKAISIANEINDKFWVASLHYPKSCSRKFKRRI